MEEIPRPAPTSSHPQGAEGGVTEDDFNRLSRSAYVATEEAQNLDAQGSTEAAFKQYEKALQLIDQALAKVPSAPSSSSKVEESAYKIRLARKEILERVSDLQHRDTRARNEFPEPRQSDLPPAYSDIANYTDLTQALEEIAEGQSTAANPLPINAREVFSIPGEVQIYFISAEDNVSAPSYPSFLRLVRMEPYEQTIPAAEIVSASVPAFLQVGDWTYPLIPGHSPLFRSTEGIYIFPDLSSQVTGSYVGLILPDSVDPELRRTFEESLLALVGVEQFPSVLEQHPKEKLEKPPRPAPPSVKPTETKEVKESKEATESKEPVEVKEDRRLSTKIAEGLMTGAEAVSRGIIYGAGAAAGALDKGAAYIQSRMEPAKEKSVIKPEVKQGMKTAKYVSGKAVKVSGFVVSQLGRATVALGRHMAPHVHKASTKFLARTVAHDEVDAAEKVDQVLEVTTGAVVGFGTVYFGLEHAARTLVSSLANNTVNIVQHKYGEEAGELAGDGVGTCGNAALTALNVKNLAPKSVARKVGKDVGKAVIKAHKDKSPQ